LAKAGIAYGALDNGIRSCADPARLQRILDALNERKIEAVVRKWFARLPHPFTRADRAAGYRYDLSILQAEFARTQVFDRPLSGRHLFEEVIRVSGGVDIVQNRRFKDVWIEKRGYLNHQC